ncbi:MAG: hypothetical protein QM380_07565 [Bacillota bacterium]|nr:hypothetical protein [Bacillota bacterium]
MTRAQIAYRVADIVDWELQKKRRARAKVNKPKPMTREQFIKAVVRDQEKRRLSR